MSSFEKGLVNLLVKTFRQNLLPYSFNKYQPRVNGVPGSAIALVGNAKVNQS